MYRFDSANFVNNEVDLKSKRCRIERSLIQFNILETDKRFIFFVTSLPKRTERYNLLKFRIGNV